MHGVLEMVLTEWSSPGQRAWLWTQAEILWPSAMARLAGKAARLGVRRSGSGTGQLNTHRTSD